MYLLKFLATKDNKELKILDFGCGYGQYLIALRKMGFHNLVACDINNHALEALRGEEIETVHADNVFINYQNCFDLVLMNHVLEHFPKEQVIETLAKIKKHLLSSQGCLIISVPNAQSYTGCYWAYEDFTHHTLFTAGSLLHVLKLAGFKQVVFLDPLGLEGKSLRRRVFMKFFLKIYELKNKFWMKVTDSHYHDPSPKIYSYDIKVIAID